MPGGRDDGGRVKRSAVCDSQSDAFYFHHEGTAIATRSPRCGEANGSILGKVRLRRWKLDDARWRASGWNGESLILVSNAGGGSFRVVTNAPPIKKKTVPKTAILGPWGNHDGRKIRSVWTGMRLGPSSPLLYGRLFREEGFGPIQLTWRRRAWGRCHGKSLRPRFSAQMVWDLTDVLRDGSNELVVDVTNSLAAQYAPKQRRPSGLFGPVMLHTVRGTTPD